MNIRTIYQCSGALRCHCDRDSGLRVDCQAPEITGHRSRSTTIPLAGSHRAKGYSTRERIRDDYSSGQRWSIILRRDRVGEWSLHLDWIGCVHHGDGEIGSSRRLRVVGLVGSDVAGGLIVIGAARAALIQRETLSHRDVVNGRTPLLQGDRLRGAAVILQTLGIEPRIGVLETPCACQAAVRAVLQVIALITYK